MSKVICMLTREEMNEVPASKEEGDALILNLLNYELNNCGNLITPQSELISNLMAMIENSTGASRFEVMDRIYSTRANKL